MEKNMEMPARKGPPKRDKFPDWEWAEANNDNYRRYITNVREIEKEERVAKAAEALLEPCNPFKKNKEDDLDLVDGLEEGSHIYEKKLDCARKKNRRTRTSCMESTLS